MTRADLAAALRVTPGALSHWMTGRRACPSEVLERLAEILRIDKDWLIGGTARSTILRSYRRSDRHRTGGEVQMADAAPSIEWGFRDAPEDGGRDFGNPNVYATPPDVETLVRESGQNSHDAELPGATVHLRYTVIELTRGTEGFSRFMEALRFEELKRHLERAAETKSKLGTRLRAGLERLTKEPKLLLLRVDDYGTSGLHGEERNDTKPFAALVRDNLNSAKETSTAGGSYGLGKAVLWRCSDISTVLLGSHIGDDTALRSRVIGKAELTWHELDGERYAGPGWLAEPGTKDSVWNAEDLMHALYLRREETPAGMDARRASGTSILIVGFRDPKTEAGGDPSGFVEKLAHAAAVNFWPAMIEGRLSVSVERIADERREQQIIVDPRKHVPAFADSLERHKEALIAERLSEPGDVIRVPVTITIPATRPDAAELLPHPELQAETHLLVRLAESDDDIGTQQTNTVALVRGRGMVTRYWMQTGIVVGARPFHAVLLAGEAVGSDDHHLAVEQFLRLSEPPAHNKWEFNDELREKYQRGAKARLDDFHRAITDALRDAVKPAASGEDDGPEDLKRLLQLEGPPPPESPPATLRQVDARLVGSSWHVAGEIHINDRTKRWSITPRLSLDVESGSPIRVRWSVLEAAGPGVQTDGESLIVAEKSRKLSFRGVSDPTSHREVASRCRAKLDILCRRVASSEGE
jgi:transcriptional regulator with XRE-family HTH domain